VNFLEQSKTSAGISAESAAKARSEISITRRYFADMLILMVVPAVMAWYYYGGRAVRLMVLSVLTAVLCEAAGSFIFKAQASVSDLSAVATGLMTSLCMPASAPYYLPCIASAFAVIVAKLPFGNARSHMFTPAAAGIAFVTICMPDKVFSYPAILSSGTTAVSGGQGFFPGTSIAYMLSQKNSVGTGLLNYVDVLVGSVSGPMGATCSIALFGALLFLAVRRPKNFTVSVSFLAVCFIYALLFPRVLTGRFVSAFMEICGGTLLFSSVFFLTDDKLLPKSFYARICYGAAAGLMCMIMRSVGKFEDSTVFAVLLANGLVTAFDKLPLTKRERHLVAAENAKVRAALADKLEEKALENGKGGAENA
jgi:Na+-translocating ferredoxin:NAD+ oxidoreductase RnfD subunit